MSRPTLDLGDSGSDVAALHQALAECGFPCGSDVYSLPPVFGPETLEAVWHFQSCNVGPDNRHLVPDGVVGPKTWWSLGNAGSEPLFAHTSQAGGLPDMPAQEASNPVAAAALASAWGEFREGVREVPDGSNRGPRIDLYTGFQGRPLEVKGPSWCAYFVSWNFARAPGGSPFGRIGGAQAIVAYCRRHYPGSVVDLGDFIPGYPRAVVVPGDLDGIVKPGDLAVIPTGNVHGHVYQVAAVAGSTTWTVEGNSGNAVRTRKRPVDAARWYVNFDRYARERGLR